MCGKDSEGFFRMETVASWSKTKGKYGEWGSSRSTRLEDIRRFSYDAVPDVEQRVHRGRTMFATSASIQASWQVSLACVQ